MTTVLRQTIAVAQKDLRGELRSRYALNALGMFVVVVVSVMSFGAWGERLSSGIIAGLFWTAMFFTGVTGLGRSFVSEEERGTSLLLRQLLPSTPVYVGKLLVNLILAIVVNLSLALLFSMMVASSRIGDVGSFVGVVVLLSVSFSGALTIIAALIARAGAKGALYPVLAFPVLLPTILLGVDLLRRSVSGSPLYDMVDDLALLALYSTALILLGYYLFDYLWKD